jgi:hypothetical protein
MTTKVMIRKQIIEHFSDIIFRKQRSVKMSRGSAVGIATGYGRTTD